MKMESKFVKWVTYSLTVLLALTFLPGAFMKITQHPMVVQGIAHIGIPQAAIVPIGLLEMACLVLFLIPRTVVLGTFLLTGYLGGAVMANIINHSDFIHALVIGLLVWAAALLRVAELRNLLPLRSSRQSAAEFTRPETGAGPILTSRQGEIAMAAASE